MDVRPGGGRRTGRSLVLDPDGRCNRAGNGIQRAHERICFRRPTDFGDAAISTPRPTLAAGFALVAVAASAAWAQGEPGAAAAAEALPGWAQAALESVRSAPPLLFFGALVVATFLPFPVGLFYLAAGVAYGIGPALVWIAGCLVVSNLILHTAARTVLRPTLERIVARRGHSIPRFDSALDEALFITLIRLTPGVPYFLQNVILAVAQLDLMRFLVLSVAIQMIYVTGFVVLGRSALDGQLGWAVGGLALLVAVAAGARVLAKRRGG